MKEGLRDDAALARAAADAGGLALIGLRATASSEGLGGLGDALSHQTILRVLGDARPEDAVLSEEAADDCARLSSPRVWILDPLDGTREYTEVGRTDWAVHVALWSHGELVAGAVVLPGLGVTLATDEPPAVPLGLDRPLRIAISRTRSPPFIPALARHLDAELVPLGSAGYKIAAVIRGEVDAYVHGGGQYQLTQLQTLETESIYVLHEVVAELERPLLFSGGKDSAVMLRLAEKAFWPARIPFPVMHVDTGHNFTEVLEFRDRRVAELGIPLVVARVADAIARGTVTEPPDGTRNRIQTPVLLEALERHRFTAIFGGARREVFYRSGMLYGVHEFCRPREDETTFTERVRYRTVGDASLTAAVRSSADTVTKIIDEVGASRVTERGSTRGDDKFSEAAMEDRKREGYF